MKSMHGELVYQLIVIYDNDTRRADYMYPAAAYPTIADCIKAHYKAHPDHTVVSAIEFEAPYPIALCTPV